MLAGDRFCRPGTNYMMYFLPPVFLLKLALTLSQELFFIKYRQCLCSVSILPIEHIRRSILFKEECMAFHCLTPRLLLASFPGPCLSL